MKFEDLIEILRPLNAAVVKATPPLVPAPTAECHYCGRMIADLESAPRDSGGAYCEQCDLESVVDNALHDMIADCEGHTDALTLMRLLSKEGFEIRKVR